MRGIVFRQNIEIPMTRNREASWKSASAFMERTTGLTSGLVVESTARSWRNRRWNFCPVISREAAEPLPTGSQGSQPSENGLGLTPLRMKNSTLVPGGTSAAKVSFSFWMVCMQVMGSSGSPRQRSMTGLASQPVFT